MSTLLILFNIVVTLSGKAIRQEKKKKGSQIGKGRVAQFTFNIGYIENPHIIYKKKLLVVISKFSKITG